MAFGELINVPWATPPNRRHVEGLGRGGRIKSKNKNENDDDGGDDECWAAR